MISYERFIGKSLFERISLVLNEHVELKDTSILFKDLPPYDYNITKLSGMSRYDLEQLQMRILDASIHDDKLYHIATCKTCGKQRGYTFDKVLYITNTVPYQKLIDFYNKDGFCCGGIIK